jgi:hypothetical protein
MPGRLHFGGHQVDVLETLDQWYGPHYRYIKARSTDGNLYILRVDEHHPEWGVGRSARWLVSPPKLPRRDKRAEARRSSAESRSLASDWRERAPIRGAIPGFFGTVQ